MSDILESISLMIVCKECKAIPLIKLVSINPLKVLMTCNHCEKVWEENYFDIKKEPQNVYENNIGICTYHKQINNFFCQECQINFCIKCLDKHQSHKERIINLSNLISKEELSKKIAETKKNFKSMNNMLQDICIKRLKKEIENIEKAFQINHLINSNLFTFVETLEQNFHPNVYESIENLIQNTKFQNKKINENQTNNNIIKELESNFILLPIKTPIVYPTKKQKTKTILASTIKNTQEKKFGQKFLSELRIEKNISVHTGSIYSLCLLSDGRLASGSYDKTIKVFNLSNYQCEITIEGHKEQVLSISLLSNCYLLSGSSDTTIKIWKLSQNDYKCLKTITGHKHGINKVTELSDYRIGSCSSDKTIIIWNSQSPYEKIATLSRHTHWVNSLIELKSKKLLISGGEDKKLIFWSNKNYNYVNEIEDIECCWSNSLIEIEQNKILVGGKSKIRLINVQGYFVEDKFYLPGVGSLCCLLKLNDGNVLCSGDCQIVNLNILEDKIIEIKENAHNSSIPSLILLKDNRLISCSYQSIKVWK